MLKLVIFGCMCTILLVKAQDGPPPLPPQDGPQPPSPLNGPPQFIENNRVARQAMPQQQSGMSSMPNMQGGNSGNLGMQGLGNFPDPTAVIAKAQEVGKQFFSGRRRRQAPSTDLPMSA